MIYLIIMVTVAYVPLVNHEQSTSSMATTRMKTTPGLTYSVARAVEVTAW